MILAQGATHMDQPKLHALINKMANVDTVGAPQQYHIDHIADKYNMIVTPQMLRTVGYDYVAEQKYDGYSYICENGRFFSKRLSQAKGNEGQPIEKTGHVWYIAEILKRASNKFNGLDLHGELYIPDRTSDDMTKIMGCAEDEAQRRVKNDWDNCPRYMLIDIRSIGGISIINEPYYIRRAILEEVYRQFKDWDTHDFIQIANILNGDPRPHFRRIVAGGGEGLVIKRTAALYVPDKKPANNWIKVKKKVTLDVVITGFNEGTGKNKSLFGSIRFGIYFEDGFKECGNCSSGLDDETRAMISKDPDAYLGEVFEIEAIQESVKAFRNPVFLRLRPDKVAEQCTTDGITIKYDI